MKKISLIIPVLNEQDAIPVFYKAVREYEMLQNYDVELVFINDGSTENTENILNQLADTDPLVQVLHFSRNFGKESALFAGLEHCTGDAVIPMDVDLQDPLEVVPQMLKKWEDGSQVVVAKRITRDENFLKKMTAKYFYKFFNLISDTKIEKNVGDFRLMDREIVKRIIQFQERNLFMRGVLNYIADDYAIVEYTRPARSSGTTKYSLWKSFTLALEGITSFSIVPLRLFTYLGFFVSVIAFSYGVWIIVQKLLNNYFSTSGFAFSALVFLGGVQLIGIGVLGEYIGKIYIETKQRPRYIIKGIRNEKNND
ncbi:MAG: glycosyltransferase family 2 protein [Flavobacteriaceae bacterium]|nr:glycosyltransferase family 2 protein [Flavobacteriaceae bacterium]